MKGGTHPFSGVQIITVDVGTVIEDEETGQQATVTDDCFVTKGSRVWCTESAFELLKRKMN
tara:strand:- start:802 stop:984 length:183 start_codon:yes stop_codon:yes gene_type:complete